MLIMDQAHSLRNRQAQARPALRVLPRRFLLLLTATPVHNSTGGLYNLVTRLQPGQVPSPTGVPRPVHRPETAPGNRVTQRNCGGWWAR